MENDSVKVFLRLRPNLKDSEDNFIEQNKSTNRMIVINKAPFTFDHIFYTSSSQSEVFQIMVEPLIEKLIKGFNSSVLAYGQSGAGKTFTMGLSEKATDGMIKMSISALFVKLQEATEFDVAVSFIEIYNEKVYDLLSEKSDESIYSKGSKFNGSTKVAIASSDRADEILQLGNKNRHVRSTILNVASSRSHAMFSIFVNVRSDNVSSVMHICDLAGSEGLRSTNHTGVAQKESVNINQGLLSVSKVVQALSSGKKLIPYRDSVLTTVLQDSLNDHSYLTLLGCISPDQCDKNETMSTIRFAQSVKTLDGKNVPEFHSYLSEKQNLRARTPMKPYMLPLSRNECSTKTPGKMLPPTFSQRNTGTVKKQFNAKNDRFKSFNTPSKTSAKKSPFRKTFAASSGEMSYMQQTTESIDNNTFSILNCSSSTEVEAPSLTQNQQLTSTMTAALPSFSPLMRKIEQAIDIKFTSFMETLKSERQTDTMLESTLLQQTVKRAIQDKVNESVSAIVDDSSMVNDSTFEVNDFQPTTSTVLRQPARLQNVSRQKNFNLTKTFLETTSVGGNVQKLTKRVFVESDFDEDFDEVHQDCVVDVPKTHKNRRVTTVKTFSPRKNVRRSVRVATYRESQRNEVKSRVKPTIVNKKKAINLTDVVSSYFDRSQTVSRAEHESIILGMINKGGLKELQLLPTVGLKTAFQILSRRAVNGNFKTLSELQKLPAMNGKSWDKFLEANQCDRRSSPS